MKLERKCEVQKCDVDMFTTQNHYIYITTTTSLHLYIISLKDHYISTSLSIHHFITTTTSLHLYIMIHNTITTSIQINLKNFILSTLLFYAASMMVFLYQLLHLASDCTGDARNTTSIVTHNVS